MDSVATLSLALQSQVGSGPGLTQKGAWLVGTAYVANDVVTRSGLTYVNVLANTGSDPATDGGVHWALATVVGAPSLNTAILALADALVSGANAYASSVLARRIGILAAAVNPQVLWALGANIRVETIAAAWTEVFTANQFVDRVKALSQTVTRLRALNVDGTPASSLIRNISTADLSAWCTALNAAATDFEALELTTLPA